jgi:hypothetical protein
VASTKDEKAHWRILKPATWPDPPTEMSVSTHAEIDECPRRWALSAAEYPEIWSRRGYPPRLQVAALAGSVVHLALELITKRLTQAGVPSLNDPSATQALSTLVHKFGNVFMLLRGEAHGNGGLQELIGHACEIGARESPVERRADRLVIGLETQQALLDLLQAREIVGCERLALDDGEVDLDLIEPTRVHRAMDGHQVGEGSGEPLDAGLPTMRRAVVEDPEHAARVAIRKLAHDLGDEPTEGLDAGGFLAAPEDLGAVHVEGGQVGPSPGAGVLVLNPRGLMGAWGQGGMGSHACLDAGLLVGAQHELVGSQSLALPLAGVPIQDPSRFAGEIRIAWEDPGALLPRADGVLVQPARAYPEFCV